MTDDTFIFVYYSLLVCFLLSLIAAIFSLRSLLRTRRLMREKKLKNDRLTSGDAGDRR